MSLSVADRHDFKPKQASKHASGVQGRSQGGSSTCSRKFGHARRHSNAQFKQAATTSSNRNYGHACGVLSCPAPVCYMAACLVPGAQPETCCAPPLVRDPA